MKLGGNEDLWAEDRPHLGKERVELAQDEQIVVGQHRDADLAADPGSERESVGERGDGGLQRRDPLVERKRIA